MTDTVQAMIRSEVRRIEGAMLNLGDQVAHLRSLIELADLLAQGQAELPLDVDAAPGGRLASAAGEVRIIPPYGEPPAEIRVPPRAPAGAQAPRPAAPARTATADPRDRA